MEADQSSYKAYLIPYSKKVIIRVVDAQTHRGWEVAIAHSPISFEENEAKIRAEAHRKLDLILDKIFLRSDKDVDMAESNTDADSKSALID